MKDFFRDQYHRLATGIEQCETSHTDFRKHIECCFHVSKSIFIIVEKEIEQMQFATREDEINFFKSVKPKFSTLVEFYSTVYRAELFAPESVVEKVDYWAAEKKRAQQFISDHQELADYLESNNSILDDKYFTRSSESFSVYDKLIPQIKARQLYIELLEKKPAT